MINSSGLTSDVLASHLIPCPSPSMSYSLFLINSHFISSQFSWCIVNRNMSSSPNVAASDCDPMEPQVALPPFPTTFENTNTSAISSCTISASIPIMQDPPPRKRVAKKDARSLIWRYFELYKDAKSKHLAFCTLCKQDVNYTAAKSPGMLTRHVRTRHRTVYDAMLEEEEAKKLRAVGDDKEKVLVQSSIEKFSDMTSNFEKKLVSWLIQTYQPLQASQHPAFRELCLTLNPKAPMVGLYKLQGLLSKEAACARSKMKSILKGADVCITTDAWTSCNNVTYITCTCHFVHPETWILHHFPLGLFVKEGTSHAEDVVRHVENIWHSYDIDYFNITCIVTDTEATMVKAARIFATQAQERDEQLSWHGCIDHLLNLVTKLAFSDLNSSEGAMSAARELVGHFSSSSQAEALLLSKQNPENAVKCIQDVTTRWWSTYSMCKRLLRLQPYFTLMEAEGVLKKNLNALQWQIVKDTTTLLEPFMCAQQLLEGESYLTISMIAFIVWKIRKGLVAAIISETSSQHVKDLARKMYARFDEQWGSGNPGTLAIEHRTEGPRRRPKGIPKLALVATFLDPRFKFGPGFNDIDKEAVWDIIREMMMATVEEIPDEDSEHGININIQPQQQPIPQRQRANNNNNDLFLELIQLAEEDLLLHGEQHNIIEQDVFQTKVDAELLFYKREPHLPLQRVDESYHNPLDWWRVKQHQYPILSKIASKILAIPATSAPSERVFSVAGITIAKERSRLDPTNAGDLVFLHDALPAIQKYETGT
jgi:hypothetical protein